MAKILITGLNKNQCVRQHYLGQQLKSIPSHYSVYNCLHDMGHEVDQREVIIGEDLSKYDDVIVYIAAPRQMVTTKLFEGLYAISQRPNCILAVDDWQADDLYKGIENCLNSDTLTCDFVLNANKKTKEDVEKNLSFYISALKIIAEKKNRMLVSAFSTDHLDSSYGMHTLFSKSKYPLDRLFRFNPNPYHRNRSVYDYGHDGEENPHYTGPKVAENIFIIDQTLRFPKERRMNFASLVQSRTKKWLKTQGYNSIAEEGMILNWPIDLYGSKAEGQKRLTEDNMCKTMTRDWVTLIPEYPHNKSGWWRIRILQTALCHSIVIGSPNELQVYYGKDYPFLNLNAMNIQKLSDDQLYKVLHEQQNRFLSIHPLDKAIQREELKVILEAKK